MTGPVMPIPSEARWKSSEAKRVAAVVRRRKGLPDDDDIDFAEPSDGGGGAGKDGTLTATTMFDQVCAYSFPFLGSPWFSFFLGMYHTSHRSSIPV